jgi:hypothetical protein
LKTAVPGCALETTSTAFTLTATSTPDTTVRVDYRYATGGADPCTASPLSGHTGDVSLAGNCTPVLTGSYQYLTSVPPPFSYTNVEGPLPASQDLSCY